MRTTSSQKAKTGIFVLAGFAILILSIYFIGKQENLFSSTFRLRVDFNNVSGLQVGNFVRFDGINVGTVDDIAILNDTTVRVMLSMKQTMRRFLREDSKASIGSDGLMGDKLVQIAPGTDSAGHLKADHIDGVNPPDIEQIMVKVSDITSDGKVIMDNLADILSKMDSGKGSLGQLLNNDQLGQAIENTVQSTNKTMNTINQAATGLKQNMQAAKHSFLFRGYFKRKARRAKADSTKNADNKEETDSLKTSGH